MISAPRWAAFTLLAAACVHIPPHPIAPEATAKLLESRSLSDARMQAFVAAHSAAKVPITAWDVDTLTLAAFYFHPDLDVARAQAAVARAAVVTAAERPNPTLNLPLEHKAEAHPWIIVPNVDLTIETANRRGLRLRQARDLERSAELAIAQQAWRIRSSIRAQLAIAHQAERAVAILDRQIEVQNDLVEALEKRVAAGESNAVELAQARISGRQAQLLRRDRATQAVQARARLATSLGIPQSGLENAKLTFASALPQPPHDIRDRALLGRPDILMSLADYAAAESALRLELARQYPDLHLTLGFGWDQGARRWDLGFASILPVLSRNRGPIAEALARRSMSEANFLALQGRVIGAVDESLAVYGETLKKVDEAAAVVDAQTHVFDMARKSFDAGETDRVTLRTAELELESARLAHAEAVAQAQAALGALEDSIEQPLTGGPYSADAATAAPREDR